MNTMGHTVLASLMGQCFSAPFSNISPRYERYYLGSKVRATVSEYQLMRAGVAGAI